MDHPLNRLVDLRTVSEAIAAMTDALIASVVVSRSDRRGPSFDEGRLDIRWRT